MEELRTFSQMTDEERKEAARIGIVTFDKYKDSRMRNLIGKDYANVFMHQWEEYEEISGIDDFMLYAFSVLQPVADYLRSINVDIEINQSE